VSFSFSSALNNLVGNTPGANVSNVVQCLNDLKTYMNGNIDATNLANQAVTNAKIANQAVSTNQIFPASITADKLNAAPGQQAWQTVAFAVGSWSGSVAYFKDSLGLVHLRSDVLTLNSGGTISGGTTLFTLPVGYRPGNSQVFVISAGGAAGNGCTITSAGVVTTANGQADGNTLAFAGVHFRAEN
jgi:hypothetical protein